MEVKNIVNKVSDILNMYVENFEHKKFDSNYLKTDIDKSPIIVAYSDDYSKWCFAIMEDLSVVIPTMNVLRLIDQLHDLIPNDIEVKFTEEVLMISNLKFAEEFLKNYEFTYMLENFNI